MASRLRPTPETGRVAATRQPASAVGPSWSQRGSREARLAFRQAQRRGDRKGAMRVAADAEKLGYASQASIGSAEERLAGDFQGRQADAAVTSEIGKALTPPGLSRDMIDTPAGPRRSAEEFSSQTSATRPPIPEPPAAPGASQPPENPVTGEATPVTGDAQSRLGQRKINPLTGKPLGYDPRNPSPVDTMSRIRDLTRADGENLTRGAAIRKVNDDRRAAGRPAVDYDETIDEMQSADREADATRRVARTLGRGPTLSADPTLARSFRDTAARARTQQAPAVRNPLDFPSPRNPLSEAPPLPSESRRNPLDAPAFRTSLTTPEAFAARVKEEAIQRAREARLRHKQEGDARVDAALKNIKIPDWQQGTILGDIHRRWREFSARAQR